MKLDSIIIGAAFNIRRGLSAEKAGPRRFAGKLHSIQSNVSRALPQYAIGQMVRIAKIHDEL